MLRPFGFMLFALVHVACRGSVVDHTSSTAGGGGGGSGGGSSGPLECGGMPTVGQIVTACMPMDGDYCLPAETSPGLLVELAKTNKVCAETSPGACCDKPAYRQVVCDQPPGVNDCCYDVHYINPVVCP
ncbi:MAG: hypothetical protein IPM54_20980 [Polyangiaceae bacterium]|nr:hypothetical protein [Polyangiaceae bacterium]